MMNPHMPGLVIGGALMAFHSGLMRGRARRAAYINAVQEGRRQDAIARRIGRLENEVLAARADAHAAKTEAAYAALLRRL
jgi:outer membrane murein-binding lipoprotein Lpp